MSSPSIVESGSKPIIWIMGGPGSGKSTLCERLSKSLSYTHISTGELLRNEVMSGTRRGEEVFKLMQAGEIVCSILVADLLSEALQKNKDSQGFMIDGFPMDMDQAEAFVKEVGPPSKVIFLRANPVVLKGRLLSRNNFDDSLDSITRRLQNFVERTRPIVSRFNAVIVDAEKATTEIVQEVLRQVQKPQLTKT